MSKELTATDRAPATAAELSDQTIREWSKQVLRKWAEAISADARGWEKVGAAPPENVIDCIFSQLQVTLLGYAKDMTEADAKTEQLDQMLRVRRNP